MVIYTLEYGLWYTRQSAITYVRKSEIIVIVQTMAVRNPKKSTKNYQIVVGPRQFALHTHARIIA